MHYDSLKKKRIHSVQEKKLYGGKDGQKTIANGKGKGFVASLKSFRRKGKGKGHRGISKKKVGTGGS